MHVHMRICTCKHKNMYMYTRGYVHAFYGYVHELMRGTCTYKVSVVHMYITIIYSEYQRLKKEAEKLRKDVCYKITMIS